MGFFSKKKEQKKVEEKPKVVDEDELRDKQEAEKAANEKQIELAYRFMMQPDVQKASDTMKRTFLRKKGLSHQQIDSAFARRDQKKEDPPQTEVPKESSSVLVASGEQTPLPSQDLVAKIDDEAIEVKFERAFQSGFLNLKNSKITVLDEKVFTITNLKTLIVSQNPLTGIPDHISNLTNLRIIQLSDCNLTDSTLSSQLFNLPNLVELILSKNKISNVTLIGQLSSLQRCDLSNNDIVEIPDEIEKCQQLQLLNLSNNHLSFLPHSFTNLKALKRLTLTGNNFDGDLLQSLQNTGIEGLFKYLSAN